VLPENLELEKNTPESEPAEDEEAAAVEFNKGDAVVVFGLSSVPYLNGRRGMCVEIRDDRWLVHVSAGIVAPFVIKARNLRHVHLRKPTSISPMAFVPSSLNSLPYTYAAPTNPATTLLEPK
jgi:hypothetical protein